MRALSLALTALVALTACSMDWKITSDADGDGFTLLQGDCDESDPGVFPGQEETWYDGVDANCDGQDDYDADGDGHVALEYGGDDCHDDVPEAYPGSDAEEVFYDCVDQDCDGNDGDQDGDGFVATSFAEGSAERSYAEVCPDWEAINLDDSGAPLPGGDCWDDPLIDYAGGYEGDGEAPAPAEVFPGADREDNEAWYDNVDQNCDGESDFDADGDGYDRAVECDDTDPNTYPNPNVDDPWYDCQDQNCDGNDGDQDGDGYLALTFVDGDGVERDYTAECPDWEALNPEKLPGDCFDDNANRPDAFTAINNLPTPPASQVYPGAVEVWYDGVDQDCAEDGDFDADGDGFNTDAYPDREGATGGDCQDDDPQANPGAGERCSTDYDDDCDGQVNEVGAVDGDPYYLDADGDSFGDQASTVRLQCEADSATGYTTQDNTDCDDGDALVNPNGTEHPADDVDQDCDGDELCYVDGDGDGFGDASYVTRSGSLVCDAASLGYADDDDDCDDGDASVNPDGAEAVADGVDQDCDGDELCYVDGDGDGYGDSATTTRSGSVVCDDAGNNYADDDEDCDDSDAGVNPGETEVVADGADQDCDGLEQCYLDNDEDGFGSSTLSSTSGVNCDRPNSNLADDSDDCDDTNSARGRATYPGAAYEESASSCRKDQDGDGYGDDSPSVNGVTGGTDCDDGDLNVNIGADEVCDGLDNDCDSLVDDDDSDLDASGGDTFYADSDGDGFGDPSSSTMACQEPSGYVADDTDCDDSDAAIRPGGAELCSTNDDDDCDGEVNEDDASDAATWYADSDGDSYGDPSATTLACDQPSGYLSDDQDCDDTDAAVNPVAAEVCDSEDNDCDGLVDDADGDISGQSTWYADSDGDSFGDPNATTLACDQPSNYLADDTDCDDTDAAVFPGADELCSTAYDDDCDGQVNEDGAADGASYYTDSDGDGYGDSASEVLACSQPSGAVVDSTDCDDADGDANPGEVETDFCFDGVDNDCDGYLHNGCFDDGVDDDEELMFSELFYFTANDSFTWFELYNETAGTVDLEDFLFELEESDGTPVDSFTVSGSLTIPSDTYLVLCYSDSGVPIAPYCDYAWGGDAADFVLDDLADLVIRVSTQSSVEVDEVHFENGTNGWPQITNYYYDSAELCTSTLSAASNDSGSNWEDVYSGSSNLYGSNGSFDYYGTPGDENSRSCN